MSLAYVNDNEVLLNGISFPTMGTIRPSLISMFPPKLTIGDTSKDDEQFVSSFIQNDVLAGIGLFRILDRSQTERAWVSYANLGYRSGITLPQYVANYGMPPSANQNTPTANIILSMPSSSIRDPQFTTGFQGDLQVAVSKGIDFSGSSYVIRGPSVYRIVANPLDGSTQLSNFSPALYTASADVADAAIWQNFLWITTALQTIRFDGNIWTVDATTGTGGGTKLAVHDNKLWRLNGSTVYQLTGWGGSPTWSSNPASLPSSVVVAEMVEFRDSLGDPILAAVARDGVYNLDESSTPPIWRRTEFRWPAQGLGVNPPADVWRGDLYTFSGLDGYRLTPGNPSTIDATVGLSQDEGVPPELDGSISVARAAFNDLFLYVSQTGISQRITPPPTAILSVPSSGIRDPQFQTIPLNTAYVAQRNGQGYQIPWAAPANLSTTIPTGDMWVSTANQYRLYWNWAGNVYGMDLYPGVRNPWQNKVSKYQVTASHTTPWFQGLAESLEKMGASLKLMVQNMSPTETITCLYATDYENGWHAFPNDSSPNNVVSTNGLVTLPLGTATVTAAHTSYQGIAYNAIRFMFIFNRGTDNSKSPVLMYWLHQFQKFSPPRWGFTFQLPLSGDHHGMSPQMMVSQIQSLINSQTLVLMQFRDASSPIPATYAVRITHLQATSQTGPDFRGTYMVSCIAPADVN